MPFIESVVRIAYADAYAADQAQFEAAERGDVPTLVIHGAADTSTPPALTASLPAGFTAGLERRLIAGVGQFPQREAPEWVAEILLEWLARW